MNSLLNHVTRSLYRAQCKPGQMAEMAAAFLAQQGRFQALIADGALLTVSVFQWQRHSFVYWESVGQPLTPADLFGPVAEHLEAWPGMDEPRTFIPLMDIFHGLEPESRAHWQRRHPVERIQGRITRLQPHMVSSYIFYHYQLQEEQPGSHDKYWLIGIHENLLFFYQELPPVPEPRPGKLTTANTPDDWQAGMFPHFLLWDDAPPSETIWRSVDLILHLP
jgi:hypothetical protein